MRALTPLWWLAPVWGWLEREARDLFLAAPEKPDTHSSTNVDLANLYALRCVRSWDTDLILQDGEEDSCSAQRVRLLLPSLHTDVTRTSSWEFKWRVPSGELGNQMPKHQGANSVLFLAEEIQKSGFSTEEWKKYHAVASCQFYFYTHEEVYLDIFRSLPIPLWFVYGILRGEWERFPIDM